MDLWNNKYFCFRELYSVIHDAVQGLDDGYGAKLDETEGENDVNWYE